MLLNIDVISSVLPHSYMLLTSYSCNAETFDHNQNHANRFVYKLNLTLWSWSINQLELIAQYLEKHRFYFILLLRFTNSLILEIKEERVFIYV